MANISDSAGIFTGGVLEAFNSMQLVVVRDGDLAFAQQEMLLAMRRVLSVTQLGSAASTGGAVSRRKSS